MIINERHCLVCGEAIISADIVCADCRAGHDRWEAIREADRHRETERLRPLRICDLPEECWS